MLPTIPPEHEAPTLRPFLCRVVGSARQTPLGVLVLAALHALIGLSRALDRVARAQVGLESHALTIDALIVVALLLSSYGLWSRRPWGRLLTMALYLLLAGLGWGVLFAVARGWLPAGALFIGAGLAFCGIGLGITWYLARPSVKAAFQ